MKETALGFAASLRESQLTPRRWFGPGYWRIPYEGNYLCGMVVNRGKWRIWFFWGEYSGEFDEGLIKIVQNGVKPCASCAGDDCPKGRDITVFGKTFAGACFQFPIQFENPDAAALTCVRKLMAHWKKVARYSDSWHCS